VRKFFQSQVQVPVGFLTRPVTADHTHDDAGHSEHSNDYQRSLHHASVPLILPNTMLTAIAVMNMPAMMYTWSI